MDLDKEILKSKADRTAVKRYILLCPIFRIDNNILHQGHFLSIRNIRLSKIYLFTAVRSALFFKISLYNISPVAS